MNVKQIARECSGPPLGSYVLNTLNVYTEASSTQQTLFYETRTYRRVSTDFFLPSIIAKP